MFGRMLNSLSYRLKTELGEWRRTNQALSSYSWPWYKKALVSASEKPLIVPSILVLIFFILPLIVTCTIPFFITSAKIGLPQPSSLLQYFLALWAVQSTVAAMVYPIVIGFVSLILQRRHSAKANLQIYFNYSAAILTGISAIFLVLTMGLQLLLDSIFESLNLIIWFYTDAIWFLLNIIGVIWFLTQTFVFLRPERRAEIQRAYALNCIWPVELRLNLESNRFSGASDCGWLPGPRFDSSYNNSTTSILMSPLGGSMGNIQVTDHKKDGWFVHDVRFVPLSWAIRRWQRREERHARHQSETQSKIFIIVSFPGNRFQSKDGICRTEGGDGLQWIEKFLVRRSFIFKRKRKSPYLGLGDIFDELIAEVQANLESNQQSAFQEALADLIELHVAIVLAGAFFSSAGRDNYANLVDRNWLFGEKLYESWTKKYHNLVDLSINRLLVDVSYFERVVNVPNRIFSRLLSIRPVSILVGVLRQSGYFHYKLNRWWSRIVEEQGALSHGPCEATVPRAPAYTVYSTAIRSFVGGWEVLKNINLPITFNNANEWDKCREAGELYAKHLDETIAMLFDSLLIGNQEGAEWLCDTLIKWWDSTTFSHNNQSIPIKDDRKLTLQLLRKPWEEAKEVIDISLDGLDSCIAQQVLAKKCIKNYWIDLCSVSLYAMLQFGKECDCERSLPAHLIKNLVQGKSLRAGGGEDNNKLPICNPVELLIAIIRQYHIDGGYSQGYRSYLETLVERILRLAEPEMISGRIYTRVGTPDMDSLRDGQLILLCLLVDNEWTMSKNFIETVQGWGSENDDVLRNFERQLSEWQLRLADVEFMNYENIYSCISSEIGSANELDSAISVLKGQISILLDNISGFREFQIQSREIGKKRLRDISIWSSKSAFCEDSGDVPVSLFRNVNHSSEKYKEYGLRIRKVKKAAFVDPPMVELAVNEEEWYDHTVRSHVAFSVMTEAIRKLDLECIEVNGAAQYWEKIEDGASIIQKNGRTPILLVAGQAEPSWLLEWAESNYSEFVELPTGLRWHRDNRIESKAYLCSLNEIPVYIAPIGAGSSILLAREAFDTLEFSKFEDKTFVEAYVEEIDESETLLDLKLTWRFNIILQSQECWKLQYTKNES